MRTCDRELWWSGTSIFAKYIRVIKSRDMRAVGHVGCVKNTGHTLRLAVRKPKKKSLKGKPKRKWEHRTKTCVYIWRF